MNRGQEYRFRMGAYTPETLPLGRLADYLEELATLLGEDKFVHLLRLEAGSTVLVHKIDVEAVPKVRDRTAAVRRGEGAPDAMRAYRRINRLLREDNGTGVLLEETGAEVIRFPGREDERPEFTSVPQQGELHGEVVRIGGVGESVPVMLQAGGQTLTGIYAKRSVAKPLARHLFEPVRLYGTGRWTRSADGDWQVERFVVDRFDVLDERSLSSLVLALRAVPGGEWGSNAVNDILVHRGVQKIHPIGALVWLEPRKRGVCGQRRMNLLSAPVH